MAREYDIYWISDWENSWHKYACRIIKKALERRYQIHVQLESEEYFNILNSYLWGFSKTSFIPHDKLGQNTENLCPVVLDWQGSGFSNFIESANVKQLGLLVRCPENHERCKYERIAFVQPDKEGKDAPWYAALVGKVKENIL